MKTLLPILVLLSITWIIVVFSTGITGLIIAQELTGSPDSNDLIGNGAGDNENPIYYSGYRFNNPEDFREYLELVSEYESASSSISNTEALFDECYTVLTNMSTEYDRKFGGKIRTYRSLEAKADIQQKLGECQAFSQMLNAEKQALAYLNQSMSNKILASATEV